MKQIDLQLTGGNNDNSRRKLDFYPTPKNVTIALLDFLQLPPNRIIWEPCCGNYAMSNVIKSYGHEVIETDVIYGDNFFETTRKCDAIITNPPFNPCINGDGKTLEEMILKALSEARLVAFLFKSQFWHTAKRLSLFENNPPTYILPLTWRPDFLEHLRKEGEPKGAPTMEVLWCVWQKPLNGQTIYKPLKKPKI